MTVWLVLMVLSGDGSDVEMMHVGNFSSFQDCENIAKTSTTPVQPQQKGGIKTPFVTMMCIQANQTGTTPPE